ncbi:MAG: hypothetical protein NTW78_06060 [Campylobacterales bacterium]|nr:hypothetical protein [Campylobacterales bacterium]
MLNEIKRVGVLLIVFAVVLFAFLSGEYELLTSPLQLVLLKTQLVLAGLLLAHVARKQLFPKMDLTNDNNWQHFLIVLSFYLVIPYCFSMGG